jgi:hypothetical protein
LLKNLQNGCVMSKKPWRTLSHDEVIRLAYLTRKGVPLADIAEEFHVSRAWICTKQRELGMVNPATHPALKELSEDDLSTLNLAAEVRGTTISGLISAVMQVLAKEPDLIDAVLDDKDYEQ